MSFNTTAFNTSPFNIVIVSQLTYTTLQFLKCANWAEGPSHGGIETVNAVDICWDYISEYENVNGATDYRKGFIRNYGELSTGECVIRPSFVAPNALVGRLNVTIALGTTSDSMSNRPSDNSFGAGLITTIDPGISIPIWIKRVITAGGSDPGSYLGIKFVLTVSEQ